MKNFNSIKLLSSFREISNVLEIVSIAIKIFAFVLVILQGILLIRDSKSNNILLMKNTGIYFLCFSVWTFIDVYDMIN